MKAVVLYSGGLDSTTLLYDLRRQGETITAVWVDYSQKSAEKERKAVEYHADICGCEIIHLNMADIFKHSNSSLLKGNGQITEIQRSGQNTHYVHRRTEVECRNAVLISAAVAIATQLCANESVTVYYGAIRTAENLADCSAEFVRLMDEIARVCSHGKVTVKAPYIDKGKDWVMQRAKELGINSSRTWSCYEGGTEPCGVCPACLDRKILEEL